MATQQITARQIKDLTITDTQIAAAAGIATTKLADGAEFIRRDGSVVFTGPQSMGGFLLTNVGAGAGSITDPLHAANKAYVDSVVVGSRTWKELILHPDQLLNGGTGGILQGMLARIAVLPTADDTFIITDGTTTETFTWKASAGAAFEVTLGGTIATAQTNLAAEINLSSTLWSAVETTGLDPYFVADVDPQLLIHRTLTSLADDRIWSSIGTTTNIQVVEFATGPQDYAASAGTESDIPTSDPAVKQFGFGRLFASLETNESHLAAEDNCTHTWDEDDQVWQQTDASAASAGAGLTRSGQTLDVGAGVGITVNVDDVAVKPDTTVTGGQTIYADGDGVHVAGSGTAGQLIVSQGTGASTPSQFQTLGGDATLAANGDLTLTSGFIKEADFVFEIPAGVIDDANQVYTTSADYVTSSLLVFVNGLVQRLTTDYTHSDTDEITFTTAPSALEGGDDVRVYFVTDKA